MKYTAAMIVLLAAPLVSAPPPRLVREIDLKRIVPAIPDFAPFASFAFSPDENWLAVAVGATQVEHRKSNRNIDLGPSQTLLLVPLNGTVGQQVQISPGLRPIGNPAWSPDSATVLVEGFANNSSFPPADAIAKLWNLRGDELLRRPAPGLSMGKTFDGPIGGIFGFLDSKHLLARRIPAKGVPDAFETIDLAGQVVDTWTVPKHWEVADISPERGLLAILTDQASKTLVVDHQSKKVILTKANPFGLQGYANASMHGRWQYFTESGKTLCSVGSVATGDPGLDVPTECWDVDGGRKIAQFHRFLGGAPAAASSHGSRLVLTHDIAFPHRSAGVVFPGGERVVWDFRSGSEIAAWEAPQISTSSIDHVAISSSGRYVAETAGTLLRIYELP
jgi:hypothetical protein